MITFLLSALVGVIVGQFHIPVTPPARMMVEDTLGGTRQPDYKISESDPFRCKFNSGRETIALDCFLEKCVTDLKGGGSWCNAYMMYNIHSANEIISRYKSMARAHLNYTNTTAVFFDSVKYSSVQLVVNGTSGPVVSTVYGSDGFNIKTMQIVNTNEASTYTTAKSIENEADNLIRGPDGQLSGKIYGSFSVSKSTYELREYRDNGKWKEKTREVLGNVVKNAVYDANGGINMPLASSQIFSYVAASLSENSEALQSVRFVPPEFFKLEYILEKNGERAVFSNKYLKNNRGKLWDSLVRDLKLEIVTKDQMAKNPELKDFVLIPLIASGYTDNPIGHIGCLLVDLSENYRDKNVYLFDSSLFFYLTKDSGGKNNAFGEAPEGFKLNSGGLIAKISKGRGSSGEVILLNDMELQGKTGDCGFFASEFMIYVLDKFRQIKDIKKAFKNSNNNNELLIEIASKVSATVDPQGNRARTVVMDTDRDNIDLSKYDEFLIGNSGAEHSVWILKSNEAQESQFVSLISIRQAALQNGIGLGYAACKDIYKKKDGKNIQLENCKELIVNLFSVSGIVYESNNCATNSNKRQICQYPGSNSGIDEFQLRLSQSYIKDPYFKYLLRRGDVEIDVAANFFRHIVEKYTECSGSTSDEKCLPGIVLGDSEIVSKNRNLYSAYIVPPKINKKKCAEENSYECWNAKNPKTVFIRKADGKYVNKDAKNIVDELSNDLENMSSFVYWRKLNDDDDNNGGGNANNSDL
ncbi:MAG: hypothetical protein LBI70_02520 [Rickettsiales bacterium]|jgi:hypothetical protein|nr:hypothetical protein [Rickettsiales bacterium]